MDCRSPCSNQNLASQRENQLLFGSMPNKKETSVVVNSKGFLHTSQMLYA